MAIDRGLNATVSSNPLGIDNDDYVATVVGPQGIQGEAGAGDMISANNLSDLINTTNARSNLGVDSAGTVNYTHPSSHTAAEVTGLGDITLDGGYF